MIWRNVPARIALSYVAHVAGPVSIGAAIYILFRAESLLVFRWIDLFGAGQFVSSLRNACSRINQAEITWLLFSLPDGLWVYAITALMILIWRDTALRHPHPWTMVGLLLAGAGEVSQGCGFVPGTFDAIDILFCLFGAILPFILLKRDSRYSKNFWEAANE